MKWQPYIIAALLCIGIAGACTTEYVAGTITIIDDIIPAGEGATCNITTYSDEVIVDTALMNRTGLLYTHEISDLAEGIYTAGIYCNYTYNASFSNMYYGECKFEVGEDENMILAFLVGIIMLSAALLYIAFNVAKVHNLLKILFITIVVVMQMITGQLIVLAAEDTKYASLSLILYGAITWIIWFYALYLFLYFIYTWFDMMGKIPKKFSLRGRQ